MINIERSPNDSRRRAVLLGGGTGTSAMMRATKYVMETIALCGNYDNGGQSDKFRREYDSSAIGDLSQIFVAALDDMHYSRSPTQAMKVREMLDNRFGGDSVRGSMLASAEQVTEDIYEALELLEDIFRLRGHVRPITRDKRHLVLNMPNGEIVHGEHKIGSTNIDTMAGAKIGFTDISPEDAKTHNITIGPNDNPAIITPEAEHYIANSDVVIIGPGDKPTSVLPVLATEGVRRALEKAKLVLYVANLVNRDYQLPNHDVADLFKTVEQWAGEGNIDGLIYNTGIPDLDTIRAYEARGERGVIADEDRIKELGVLAIGANLLSTDPVVIQPGDALAGERSFMRHGQQIGDIILQLVLERTSDIRRL